MSEAAASRPLRWWSLELLPDRFPKLHGLRAIAIVSVVQHHVTDGFQLWRLLPVSAFTVLSRAVWFGMDLFFVLSGFLIGSILLEARRRGPIDYANFYVRRTFRIFPSYYVVLTLFAFGVARWLHIPLTPQQREYLPWEYLYLTNYIPRPSGAFMPWGWSLAVEEHFYLAVPLLLYLLLRVRSASRQLVLLGVGWSLGTIVRVAAFLHAGSPGRGVMLDSYYVRSHFRFDVLLAGLWIAVLEHNFRAELDALLARARPRRAMVATSLALFGLLLFYPLQHASPLWTLFCWGGLTSLAYGLLIVVLLRRELSIADWLGWRGFRRWATLGYGIYLVHPVVISLLVVPLCGLGMVRGLWSFGAAWWLSLVGGLAVSTLGAWLLHVAIERPAMRLRDRLAPSDAASKPSAARAAPAG